MEKIGIELKANGQSCGTQVQDLGIFSLVGQDRKMLVVLCILMILVYVCG